MEKLCRARLIDTERLRNNTTTHLYKTRAEIKLRVRQGSFAGRSHEMRSIAFNTAFTGQLQLYMNY